MAGRVDIDIDGSSLGRLSREQTAVWHNRFAEALVADLPNAAAVLFFDTFEKAGIETQEWIVQALLPLLVNSALGLTMVLAGQKIPALTRAWRHQHEHTRLTGLSTADWTDYAEQYAKRHGRPRPEASQLALLHGFLSGKPRGMVDAVAHLCGSSAR